MTEAEHVKIKRELMNDKKKMHSNWTVNDRICIIFLSHFASHSCTKDARRQHVVLADLCVEIEDNHESECE